jgi:hypothetical protein
METKSKKHLNILKNSAAVLLVGLLFSVSQHLQAQIKVEKGKTVSIEIPNLDNEPPPSSSKLDIVNAPAMTTCNIQVKRGSEKTDVKIDPKSNKGIYKFEGRELGQETISWEGKTKFRGFKTLRACNTNGQLTVETIESAEVRAAKLIAQKKAEEEERFREEARLAQKKAEEEERFREEARLAQKKAEEEERAREAAIAANMKAKEDLKQYKALADKQTKRLKELEAKEEKRALKEAKLAAQAAEKKKKQMKAEMDKQTKRSKDLEGKLKIAEAEAAKTPEQKEKEARLAEEAKALAEEKLAVQMKEEKRKRALEEKSASRKMKVEERKRALEEVSASRELRKQKKEKKREEARTAAQMKKEKKREEVRMAEEKKREEARMAEEKKREEARMAEERRREQARMAEERRREKEIKIGQLMKNAYWEWKVTDVMYTTAIRTENRLFDPDVNEFTNFVAVEVYIKNMQETPQKVKFAGIKIVSEGKEYFYEPETIMSDGWNRKWYIELQPLIPVKTWEAYRVPKDLSGEVFFSPSDSDKNSINVRLGYISDGTFQRVESDYQKTSDSNNTTKIYKVNDFLLSSAYAVDPFDVRNRLIGKIFETKLYVFNFFDEGSHARLAGDGSGLTCLMSGSEFSKNKSKGVKVVRGRLVEWSGGLSLNDCVYISDDESWKATDDIKTIN